MEQQIYSRSAQILQRFTPTSSNQPRVIYEPGSVTPWDVVPITRYYGFITDLRMKVDIDSIVEQELPEISAISSKTERITAIRDMEWRSPRKEVELLLEGNGQDMIPIANISLVNRLPYYHVNLMPYFTDNGIFNVASDSRILARIVDAGYGLLEGTDDIVIFGSVKEEVTTLPTEDRDISFCQPLGVTVGTSSVQLLQANINRLQTTFVNTHSSAKIFLHYGNVAELGKGICLMPNGGSYEINRDNPYNGMISAIADAANSTLSVLECV